MRSRMIHMIAAMMVVLTCSITVFATQDSAAKAGVLPIKKYTTQQATDLIKKAEEIRSLDRSKAEVTVETINAKQKTIYDMMVLQAPGRKAYLEFKGPAEERGRRMLAIRTTYWSKFPDSKRIVSISRREAIGNSAFAIADVFQMDVDEDYNPNIIGEESFKKADCYKVQLDAKHKDAPYHRIVYTVRKADGYPLLAQFYGASGQKLKTMSVEKDALIAGRIRPSILKMVDETTAERASWWYTKSVVKTDIPNEVFTQNYLKYESSLQAH